MDPNGNHAHTDPDTQVPSGPDNGGEEKISTLKERRFWLGVILWIGINAIGFTLIDPESAPFLLLANILLILWFGFGIPGYKKVALGMLTAYAVNFLISLFLNMGMNSVCGIPFFIGGIYG